eukprot:9142765-Karenia_brevis.AAC.1
MARSCMQCGAPFSMESRKVAADVASASEKARSTRSKASKTSKASSRASRSGKRQQGHFAEIWTPLQGETA